MLQHGVHLGQEAEMVTDSLRALLLDAAGYDTQVFEFVSLEHTNKNKMILAVKRADTPEGHADNRAGADPGDQAVLRHPGAVPGDAESRRGRDARRSRHVSSVRSRP